MDYDNPAQRLADLMIQAKATQTKSTTTIQDVWRELLNASDDPQGRQGILLIRLGHLAALVEDAAELMLSRLMQKRKIARQYEVIPILMK
jgi:hypothetical protein